MNLEMIKSIAYSIIGYTTLAFGVVYYYWGMNWAISVLIGGTLMLINIASLTFLWKQVFFKKSIALAVIIIIFKYAILALILWGLASFTWMKLMGFLIGIGSLIFGLLFAPVIKLIVNRN